MVSYTIYDVQKGPCTHHAYKDVDEHWILGMVNWRTCTGAPAWLTILLTTRDTQRLHCVVELITLSSLLEYFLYFVECMMSCCLSQGFRNDSSVICNVVGAIHWQLHRAFMFPVMTIGFSLLIALEVGTSIHYRIRVDCQHLAMIDGDTCTHICQDTLPRQ